jgi:hypothetical protein
MALVTLTSDLGSADFYLAALKGAIISNAGYVPLVDITHAIKPFDIKQAAFVARNAARYFPKGSIHVIHVNATDGKGKLLVAIVDEQYFIAFDNGLLSLAFEKTPHQTYQVNDELLANHSLLFEDAIGKVVNLLVKEFKPTDFAHLATETIHYRLLQPIPNTSSIRGTVIHIDNFGNAIVNITKTMFTQFTDGKRFTIMVNIASATSISAKYDDVDEGEMVCLFNSSGYLEVAINKGKAENLLGLKIDSPVLVLLD